jgi:hypothetical protein
MFSIGFKAHRDTVRLKLLAYRWVKKYQNIETHIWLKKSTEILRKEIKIQDKCNIFHVMCHLWQILHFFLLLFLGNLRAIFVYIVTSFWYFYGLYVPFTIWILFSLFTLLFFIFSYIFFSLFFCMKISMNLEACCFKLRVKWENGEILHDLWCNISCMAYTWT